MLMLFSRGQGLCQVGVTVARSPPQTKSTRAMTSSASTVQSAVGIVSGRRNRVRPHTRTTSTHTVTTNGDSVQSGAGIDVATTNVYTATMGAGTATTHADTVTTGAGNRLTRHDSSGISRNATPSTQTVATNIVIVTTGSGSGLGRNIGVGTIPSRSTLTRPSTIGIVTGAGAERTAEASGRGGGQPVSASDGMGAGGQSEESPGQSQQPQSTVTTGNDTVPTSTAAATRTTTTATVSGPSNTTSGTDEVIQDSDVDPLSVFLGDSEMEEQGRRWHATLPRETDTSSVDQVAVSISATPNQVPVSSSATPNPVTSNHTITRPPGTVRHFLGYNALVKGSLKITGLKAALIAKPDNNRAFLILGFS